MTATPLFAANLGRLPNVKHGFFTRLYGNAGFSGEDSPDQVTANRATMAREVGVETPNLLCCHQIHSMDVVTVTEPWPALQNPRADAMVTKEKDIALGILTADCVPVLLADAEAGVIGAAHAGWRGAIGGILENTVAAMEKLGARRGKIVAALGPCIGQRSYEVGPDFPEPFLAESDHNKLFFRPSKKSGHFMFDLPGYVVNKVSKLGAASVAAPPADTCADPERYFSYRYSTLRGEKRDGNLMSCIALVK